MVSSTGTPPETIDTNSLSWLYLQEEHIFSYMSGNFIFILQPLTKFWRNKSRLVYIAGQHLQ